MGAKTEKGKLLKFAQKGNLVARLANGRQELEASQRLRYQVFYQELSAIPDVTARKRALDADEFDEVCDHLLVVRETDECASNMIAIEGGELVGTYRLLGQRVAEESFGFYSQKEFALDKLIARKPEHKFLELGRSCVHRSYRTRPVVELLWQGIWNYLRFNKLDVMIGCASLEGTDVEELRVPLSFLLHRFKPPADWSVVAHQHCNVPFSPLPISEINDRKALKMLPPLIKGYLRLGAYIGEGAVFDHQFNTTDVMIILPVSAIDSRYFNRFGAPDESPQKTANSEKAGG